MSPVNTSTGWSANATPLKKGTMDGDQILVFKDTAAFFRHAPGISGRRRGGIEFLVTTVSGFGTPPASIEVIAVMVSQQANAVQRFKNFKTPTGSGPLLRRSPNSTRHVIGARSYLIQECREFATAAVNVSDNDCCHIGRIFPRKILSKNYESPPSPLFERRVCGWQTTRRPLYRSVATNERLTYAEIPRLTAYGSRMPAFGGLLAIARSRASKSSCLAASLRGPVTCLRMRPLRSMT